MTIRTLLVLGLLLAVAAPSHAHGRTKKSSTRGGAAIRGRKAKKPKEPRKDVPPSADCPPALKDSPGPSGPGAAPAAPEVDPRPLIRTDWSCPIQPLASAAEEPVEEQPAALPEQPAAEQQSLAGAADRIGFALISALPSIQ